MKLKLKPKNLPFAPFAYRLIMDDFIPDGEVHIENI